MGRGCALQIGIARNERSFLGLRERVGKKKFYPVLSKDYVADISGVLAI